MNRKFGAGDGSGNDCTNLLPSIKTTSHSPASSSPDGPRSALLRASPMIARDTRKTFTQKTTGGEISVEVRLLPTPPSVISSGKDEPSHSLQQYRRPVAYREQEQLKPLPQCRRAPFYRVSVARLTQLPARQYLFPIPRTETSKEELLSCCPRQETPCKPLSVANSVWLIHSGASHSEPACSAKVAGLGSRRPLPPIRTRLRNADVSVARPFPPNAVAAPGASPCCATRALSHLDQSVAADDSSPHAFSTRNGEWSSVPRQDVAHLPSAKVPRAGTPTTELEHMASLFWTGIHHALSPQALDLQWSMIKQVVVASC